MENLSVFGLLVGLKLSEGIIWVNLNFRGRLLISEVRGQNVKVSL